jgi:hypothetical protein
MRRQRFGFDRTVRPLAARRAGCADNPALAVHASPRRIHSARVFLGTFR